ncbi:SMAD/FHA domain-containing protein, partial [Lineolata rhizophorae]
KQQPNFAPTGLLAREANTVAVPGPGAAPVVLRYHEPPDARRPPASADWRLFAFKDGGGGGGGGGDDADEDAADPRDVVALGARSCWLVGREAAVADLKVAHPSCSKQHAVVQFRHRPAGAGARGSGVVRPYLIDLESANGTWLNGERVEAGRYVELMNGDVVRFGLSRREYVVMLAPREVGRKD